MAYRSFYEEQKIMKSWFKRFFFVLVIYFGFTTAAQAADSDAACHDANIIGPKLITDICWTCVFPIRIAGITISPSGDGYPSDAVNNPVCLCYDNLGVPKVGITTSMWEPYRLVEFQTVAGCSSVLGGIRFPFNPTFIGTQGNGDNDVSDAFFMHYHYYAFPLMIMLDLFIGPHCNAGGMMDLDLMYLSEVDPTWNNDELAFFTNPEAALVANPVAALACIPDAISSSVSKTPMKQLFWCAGSWGNLYPLSGTHVGMGQLLHNTSLLKARVQASLHRRGLAWGTMGSDAMCNGKIQLNFPKTQYKYSMMHPVAEANSTHVVGESSMLWGAGRRIPAVGEHPIYTVWRWKDCCNY